MTSHMLPEVRDRAARLVAKFPVIDPMSTRAVEAAEWIGTPDAVALLRQWGDGPEGAQLTREAKAALARLKSK